MSRPRGYALSELLIVLPLLLLLCGLIYQQVVASSKRTAQLTTQAQLQATAVVAMQRLADDLNVTPAAGIGYLPPTADNAAALSVHRLSGVDPSGMRTYEPTLVVYSHDAPRSTLVRREWRALPGELALTLHPLEACRPDASQLARLAQDSTPVERIVAHDVAAFTVTSDAPSGFIGDPLTVRLLMRRQAVSAAVEEHDLRRTITLRN